MRGVPYYTGLATGFGTFIPANLFFALPFFMPSGIILRNPARRLERRNAPATKRAAIIPTNSHLSIVIFKGRQKFPSPEP